MSKPLGLGVIGSGVIAIQAVFMHLQEEDTKDKVYLAAVCDPVPGRAKDAAEEYGIENYYESIDDLLADPNVDVVSICSPIDLHYEQGLQSIKAGKSVHFNKTMALTTAEADELIAEAEKHNVKLVASPGMMYWPGNRKIRTALLENKFGKVTWAMAGVQGVLFYHLREDTRKNEKGASKIIPAWYYKKPSGGPQYDSTAYALHSITGVMGPAKRVFCMSGQIMQQFKFDEQIIDSEVDDNIMMVLDFGNAVYGFIYSALKGEPYNGFTPSVFGTEGKVANGVMNDKPLFTDKMGAFAFNNLPLNHLKLPQPHVYYDLMQLVEWVRNDTPSIATAEHARHVIEIIEAGWESSATGKAVDLKTTFIPTTLEELK